MRKNDKLWMSGSHSKPAEGDYGAIQARNYHMANKSGGFSAILRI
jgi:hypothetical protein